MGVGNQLRIDTLPCQNFRLPVVLAKVQFSQQGCRVYSHALLLGDMFPSLLIQWFLACFVLCSGVCVCGCEWLHICFCIKNYVNEGWCIISILFFFCLTFLSYWNLFVNKSDVFKLYMSFKSVAYFCKKKKSIIAWKWVLRRLYSHDLNSDWLNLYWTLILESTYEPACMWILPYK